jgi:hypothetical protein
VLYVGVKVEIRAAALLCGNQIQVLWMFGRFFQFNPHAALRRASIAMLAFCALSATSSAAPTIGGASVTGLPIGSLRVMGYESNVMIGALAMHSADAFSWDEYTFWRSRGASGDSGPLLLQSIYQRPASRANFPFFLLSDEIVTKLYETLLGVTSPPSAGVLFWTNRLNTLRTSNPPNPYPEGQLILDFATAALGTSASGPPGQQLRHRLDAALIIKKESNTTSEQNSSMLGPTVYAISRPRLVSITDDVATYNSAVAPLSRLNWLIDQSAIAPGATFNAATGVLTVAGTELVALAGANNDIDLSKITLYGDGAPYTLTSGFVEITSATSFQVTLNAADRFALSSRINRDGTLSQGNVKYLVAAAQGWNGPFDPEQPDALTGTRITASNTAAVPVLNIDNSDASTQYDAASDGVLLLRYLFGLRGDALTDGALGSGATRDAAQVTSYLSAFIPANQAQSPFDVDGDGIVSPLTDGIMILRRLLNPTAAISNAAAMSAITVGAKRGTRTDAQIVTAIDALKP